MGWKASVSGDGKGTKGKILLMRLGKEAGPSNHTWAAQVPLYMVVYGDSMHIQSLHDATMPSGSMSKGLDCFMNWKCMVPPRSLILVMKMRGWFLCCFIAPVATEWLGEMKQSRQPCRQVL